MRGRRRELSVSEIVPRALKSLGVPTAKVSAAVLAAWSRAAEPAWQGLARPERIQAGVLDVVVSSAALRSELTQFHAARLLAVLRAALPELTLVRLRFTAGGPEVVR